MIKPLFHITLCAILVLNSMVYSVIQGSYELNKAYIVENFCVNKDKPMMNCDGKCYLAQQMKAQKEKQDANSTHKFSVDFGVYVPTAPCKLVFSRTASILSKLVTIYLDPYTTLLIREVIKPPKL